MASLKCDSEGISYGDLQNVATQLAMRLPDPPPTIASDSPVVRGSLLQRELQPGLHAVGSDVTYETDLALEQEIEHVIFCSTKIAGASQVMQVGMCEPMEIAPNHTYVISAGEAQVCRGFSQAGINMTTAGFVLHRDWFDDISTDASVEPLRHLFDAGCVFSVLPPLRGLARLASQVRHATYSGRLFDLLCEACIFGSIVELSDTLGHRSGRTVVVNSRPQRRARATRDILDARIADPPSIADLCSELAINPTTLRADFRAVFGMTIFDYVRLRRLDVARLMVTDGDLPIREIGYRVGFSNPSAFSAAYRRRFGRPPGAERAA